MTIEEIIYNVAIREGMPDKVARLIVAQSKLESSDYSSNLFVLNKNAFGYKYVGQSIATRGIAVPASEGNISYANYSKVDDSALEIVKWINRRVSENRFKLSDLETPEGYARSFKDAGYYGDSSDKYARLLKSKLGSSAVSTSQATP
jgi:hypothetical protein